MYLIQKKETNLKKKINFTNIIAILLTILVIVFFASYKAEAYTNPVELYRVYIGGETIGYIENKELLEKYIDDSQKELKEKYETNRVYMPEDLNISKELTYNVKPASISEIYERIEERSDFTVDGYTITIRPKEDKEQKEIKIYVLDNKMFEESMLDIVKIFVKEDKYNKFINKTQGELLDAGSLIEDIYIQNHISIKRGNISTKNNIFTNKNDLNRFLLYGEEISEKKYSVKRGDSISDVAFDNKLSVEEFLLVNPSFTSENNLLSEGQKVNVSIPSPIVDVVEEEHVVEYQSIGYDTKITYDESYTLGYMKVNQEGKNGRLRLTVKRQKVNGAITSFVITNREVLSSPIPKLIVRGGRRVPTIGEMGIWQWPTAKFSIITSGFSWRGGKFHNAIDIAGPGCGSPIYATNNGVIDTVNGPYTYYNGNYVYIDHNNGYFSEYAHMQRIIVQRGQTVEMGQLIGYMGNTGVSYGCHLHFGISRGRPGRKGSVYVNPLYLVAY